MIEKQRPEVPAEPVTKPKASLLRRIGYAVQNVALATHPGGAALLASGVGAEEIHNMTDRTPEINPKPVESQTSTETPNQTPTEASKSFMSEFRKGVKDASIELFQRYKKNSEMTPEERSFNDERLNARSIFNHFDPTARGLGRDASVIGWTISTGAGLWVIRDAVDNVSSGHYKEAVVKGLIGAALGIPFALSMIKKAPDMVNVVKILSHPEKRIR